MVKYFDLLKSKGKSLAELNPGSNEKALLAQDAFAAIELLRESETPIFGGDILSSDLSGKLIYAYQFWGPEYQYLNWYCDKAEDETNQQYSIRSYEVAKAAIEKAVKASIEKKRTCYVVLVT